MRRLWGSSAVAVGLLAMFATWRLGTPREGPSEAAAHSLEPLVELLGGPATCRAATPDAGLHFAELVEQRGRSHAESSRVRASDGPRAVRELSEAAACFGLAGLTERAERSRAVERRLRAHIEGSVQSHRLRLERAKESAQRSAALTEIKALRTLFEGSRGAYVEWLAREERLLQEIDKP